jgi:hypothetical protein
MSEALFAGGAGGGELASAGVARGALLVRLINVGRSPDPALMPPSGAGDTTGSG